MPGYQQEPYSSPYVAGSRVELHAGLRNFMNGVYLWMAAGIGLTAAVAWGVSQSTAALQVLYTPYGISGIGYVVLFAPLVLSFILPGRIPTMSRGAAVAAFMVFAGVLGGSLSYVPLIYSASSIVMVLLATIGMFAGMAAIGYVTKKDLTGMGQFLLMALLGAVIASVVNFLFVQSLGMSTAISAIVAVVAAGLTAYHTQSIKQLYLMHGGGSNLAILGALALYVDFINLFMSLLRLFGSRD